MACGSVHPEDQARSCILPSPGHASHMDTRGSWPNPDVQVAVQAHQDSKSARRTRKAALSDFVAHAARPMQVSAGPPDQAVIKWTKESWTAHALSVCRAWLAEHPDQEFTTAEAWWPLLPKPPEMRAMVVVVQRLRKEGLMVEVGARRLKGVYLTQDGHRFSENKLVPVYKSG